nr:hypothetical protein [Micromonospora sp. DSM 115978]
MAGLAPCVPLLVELREYADAVRQGRCASILDFLSHVHEVHGLGFPGRALTAHLDAGGAALFLLDGLDEVFDPAEREFVARQIARLSHEQPRARVLVTSRIVGYQQGPLRGAGYAHYTLQDLDSDQIGTFLATWYDLALHDRPQEAAARHSRMIDAMAAAPSVRDLAGNPMLLTILALIGKHQELPRERWKVYEHAAMVLIEHWDVNKHLRD